MLTQDEEACEACNGKYTFSSSSLNIERSSSASGSEEGGRRCEREVKGSRGR
jgi:hypothetical protein